MIKIKNLTKYYGKLRIFENLNFEIPDGDSLAIIGPSGSGKSTFLKLLLGLEAPTSGSIIVDGAEINRLNEEGLINFRKKMAMVFQFGALFDSLSVFENVAFTLREHTKLSEREIVRTVSEKLKLVELENTENIMPGELSGGMQKRVGIARALALGSSTILYDEPTTGLDPITSVTIENLMLKLSRELKATSIVVTHVMQTVYRTTKRIVLLHEGKFLEVGTPEQAQRTDNPIVKKFITGGI